MVYTEKIWSYDWDELEQMLKSISQNFSVGTGREKRKMNLETAVLSSERFLFSALTQQI